MSAVPPSSNRDGLSDSRHFDQYDHPRYVSTYKSNGSLPLPSSQIDGFPLATTYRMWCSRFSLYIACGDMNSENAVLLSISRKLIKNKLIMSFENDGFVFATFADIEAYIFEQIQLNGDRLEQTHECFGIIGIIQIQRHYIQIITKRTNIATMLGKLIYQIDETLWVPINTLDTHTSIRTSQNQLISKQIDTEKEQQYFELLQSLVLAKDSYFSPQFDLSHTIQAQFEKKDLVQQSYFLNNTLKNDNDTRYQSDMPKLPGTNIPFPKNVNSDVQPVEFNPLFTWNTHLAKTFISHFPKYLTTVPYHNKHFHKKSTPTNTPEINPMQQYELNMAKEPKIALMGPYSPYRFVTALISGFINQTSYIYNEHAYTLTIIARRGIGWAGTRFLRRGVCSSGSFTGSVANEVESEIILTSVPTNNPSNTPISNRYTFTPGLSPSATLLTSCVVYRGSIPVIFSQTSDFQMAPEIVVAPITPTTLLPAECHFRGLLSRYHGRVHIVSLIKQNETKKVREGKLGLAYGVAVERINQQFCKDGYAMRDVPLTNSDFLQDWQKNEWDLSAFHNNKACIDDHCKCFQESQYNPYYKRDDYVQQKGVNKDHTLSNSDDTRLNLVWKGVHQIGLPMIPDHSINTESTPINTSTAVTPNSPQPKQEGPIKSFMGRTLAYHTYDLLHRSKHGYNVISELLPLSQRIVDETNVFSAIIHNNILPTTQTSFTTSNNHDFLTNSDNQNPANTKDVRQLHHQQIQILSFQRGIIRINCVDCLDRTSISNYCIAKCILAKEMTILEKLHVYQAGSTDVMENPHTTSDFNNMGLFGGTNGTNDSHNDPTSPPPPPPIDDEFFQIYSQSDQVILAAPQQQQSSPQLQQTPPPSQQQPNSSGATLITPLVQLLQHIFTENGDAIASRYTNSNAMHREKLFDSESTTRLVQFNKLFFPRPVYGNDPMLRNAGIPAKQAVGHLIPTDTFIAVTPFGPQTINSHHSQASNSINTTSKTKTDAQIDENISSSPAISASPSPFYETNPPTSPPGYTTPQNDTFLTSPNPYNFPLSSHGALNHPATNMSPNIIDNSKNYIILTQTSSRGISKWCATASGTYTDHMQYLQQQYELRVAKQRRREQKRQQRAALQLQQQNRQESARGEKNTAAGTLTSNNSHGVNNLTITTHHQAYPPSPAHSTASNNINNVDFLALTSLDEQYPTSPPDTPLNVADGDVPGTTGKFNTHGFHAKQPQPTPSIPSTPNKSDKKDKKSGFFSSIKKSSWWGGSSNNNSNVDTAANVDSSSDSEDEPLNHFSNNATPAPPHEFMKEDKQKKGHTTSVSTFEKMSGIMGNAYTAAKRYYSNNFSDHTTQQAINLYLGCYIPYFNTHHNISGSVNIDVQMDKKASKKESESKDGNVKQPQHIWDFPAETHFADMDILWTLNSDVKFIMPFVSPKVYYCDDSLTTFINKKFVYIPSYYTHLVTLHGLYNAFLISRLTTFTKEKVNSQQELQKLTLTPATPYITGSPANLNHDDDDDFGAMQYTTTTSVAPVTSRPYSTSVTIAPIFTAQNTSKQSNKIDDNFTPTTTYSSNPLSAQANAKATTTIIQTNDADIDLFSLFYTQSTAPAVAAQQQRIPLSDLPNSQETQIHHASQPSSPLQSVKKTQKQFATPSPSHHQPLTNFENIGLFDLEEDDDNFNNNSLMRDDTQFPHAAMLHPLGNSTAFTEANDDTDEINQIYFNPLNIG